MGSYSFGIEEEYFISDAVTRDACRKAPLDFFKDCGMALPGVVKREFLDSQVEPLHRHCSIWRKPKRGFAPYAPIWLRLPVRMASSFLPLVTHPLGAWSRQRRSQGMRYQKVMRDLQMVGSRNLLCGLHVHVEPDDPERRVDIMTRMLPSFPLFLALSTSSPFWQARRTGLMGYRLAAYDELPRTGLPELFETEAEYRRYIDIMVEARAIEDFKLRLVGRPPLTRYPRWNCGWPTVAHRQRIPWPSPRSIGVLCVASSAIHRSTPA